MGDVTSKRAAPGRRAAPGARRVLGFVGGPMNGVSYVRFHQPFRHLRDHGFELTTLGDDLRLVRGPSGYALGDERLDGVDAVMFPQMVASPTLPDGSRLDLVTPTCEAAASRGLKIIYSLDDCPWEIDCRNPGYERIRDSIANARTLIERCDALFVTTPALRDSLAQHGKPIHVLPNAIDPARWRLRPRDSGEMRIGWAGSGSHIEDLLLFLPALERLQRKMPFRFILLGLTNRSIVDEADDVRRLMEGFGPSQRARAETFLELAGMLRRVRHLHVPYAELDAYFDLLPRSDLDIGLCPLADTPFNRHKSALKFYEYAACGTLTVASAVGPYRDEVSVVVPDETDAWYDVLELYVRDSRRREVELDRQRRFVLQERNIERLSAGWVQALRQTLATGATPRSSGNRADGCRVPAHARATRDDGGGCIDGRT